MGNVNPSSVDVTIKDMPGLQNSKKYLLAAISVCLMGSPAFADKQDPAFLPPDVTLINSQVQAATAPVAATTSVPGTAAAVGASVPGVAAPGVVIGAPTQGVGGMQSAGSGMTVNGFAVPKSGKVTAQVAQPPGTRIGGGGSADGTQQSGAPGPLSRIGCACGSERTRSCSDN